MHGLGGERLGEYRLNFNASGSTLSVDLVSEHLVRGEDAAGRRLARGAGCQGQRPVAVQRADQAIPRSEVKRAFLQAPPTP